MATVNRSPARPAPGAEERTPICRAALVRTPSDRAIWAVGTGARLQASRSRMKHVAVIALLAVCGCGPVSKPRADPTTPTTRAAMPRRRTTPTSVAVPSACNSASLTVRLGRARGYAGSSTTVLSFVNHSLATCSLIGAPTVRFEDASGHAVGAPSLPTRATVRYVVLDPGDAAVVQLRLLAIGADTRCESQVQLVAVPTLRIYLPRDPRPLHVAWGNDDCRSSSVHQLGVTPFQQG